jgi:hypothetical protein
MTKKLPDLVIPPAEMGTFFDPGNQVCGFTFSDATGQMFLLPIPGEMMSALVNEARRQMDSIEGVESWISQPGVVAQKVPDGH